MSSSTENYSNTNGESTSNRQGCAACKHQRRRCRSHCYLQPYFNFDRTEDFQATQKIFGISNMNKILKELPIQDRPRAVESLVWEAHQWKQDKVYGPLGKFNQLQLEISTLRVQNLQLNQQNQFLKNAVYTNNSSANNEICVNYGNSSSENSELEFNNGNGVNVDVLGLNNQSSWVGLLEQDNVSQLPICPLPREDKLLGLNNSYVDNSEQAFLEVEQRGNSQVYSNGQSSNIMHGHGNQLRGDFQWARPVSYADYHQFRVRNHKTGYINILDFQQPSNSGQQPLNGGRS
ncbi:LOB domain-containing protein 4-like [Mercurialis annua]|uniref:LOB domain-containing protein 4-like n=1 Tax=Mercurialis annua TaxID=3986 RepID=UPI00215DF502|nr:LOB domain-containing protein 4-like [Mercurialis annua]